MPQRRMHFGRGLIQKHCWCNSRLWPYTWSLSSTEFNVKGKKKEPSHPGLKIISEGWRQSRGDASCLLEQLINLRSPESQFHPIFSLSFCLPYLLFPPLDMLGKPHKLNSGNSGCLSFTPQPEVVASTLQSLLTGSVQLIRRLAPCARPPGAQFGNSAAPHEICQICQEARWLTDCLAGVVVQDAGKQYHQELETQRRFQPCGPLMQRGSAFSF